MRRYSLSRSMVFSGMPFVSEAMALFDGDGIVAVVVDPGPVAVHVAAPLLALEAVGRLQRRVGGILQVVFDVAVHGGAENHRRVVPTVGVERRQRPEGTDVVAVERGDDLGVALGVVGRDEDQAVLEEHRAVDVAEAVPAGVAQHDERRRRQAAACDARIGRGDSRQDAVDVDLVLGHDDEDVLLLVLQQRREVARTVGPADGGVFVAVVVAREGSVAQQREHLLLELLVGAARVNERHAAVAVEQFGHLVVLERRVGRHLEEGVAVERLDVGQRRDHRDVVLLGVADHGIELILVDRAHDESVAGEVGRGDDAVDGGRVAARIIEGELDRVSVTLLHLLEPQQEALVEFEVVAVGATLDRDGEHQGDIERLGAAQGAERDLGKLPCGGRVGVRNAQRIDGRGRGCRLVARNLEHRSGLQVGGLQSVVEPRELLFGRAEAARERVEGFARAHDVVGIALFGDAVQRRAVGFPLGLPLCFTPLAALLAANQNPLVGAQMGGVEVGVVLEDGLDGDGVAARDGVERLALADVVHVEGLLQLALRGFGLRGLGHERYLEPRVGLQPLGNRGVVLDNHLLPHSVFTGERVERLARLHGVDVVLRAVDIDDCRRFLGRVGAAEGA